MKRGLLLLVLVFAAGGLLFDFVVADDALGRVGALLLFVTVAFAVVGVVVTVGAIARRAGRSIHLGYVALFLVAATALLGPLALIFELPNPTGRALVSLHARYPALPDWLGNGARSAGVALAPSLAQDSTPGAAGPPSSSAQTANTASAASGELPSERTAKDDAGASEGKPSGIRFSAGDPGYTEPDCDPLADVTDLATAYRPEAARTAIESLAKRRYAPGLAFLQAQDDRMLAAWLGGQPPTFDGAAMRFDAAVHEGSHIWGAKRFNFATVSYPVRADLTIATRRLKNFNRSEIMSLHPEGGTDTYASTYLEGSSGAQGFNTLLDEYNAYAHSLAARVCTRDLLDSNSRVSARDGVLAMMFYVEVYLRLAREKHPADYAAIMKDAGHRRLIVTVWNRAEYWLRRSLPFPNLGIHDAQFESWAYDPERLREIARVREAEHT